PLNGARINFSLDYYAGNSKKQELLTDKDGRAAIQFSAADLKHLAYQARKTNYLSLHGEWFDQQLSSLKSEFEIKLPQGVEIGGKVNDEEGRAIVGAEISWDEPVNMLLSSNEGSSSGNARMWQTDIGQQIATTDANGNWKANCVWPEIQWVSVRIHHPDFADAT